MPESRYRQQYFKFNLIPPKTEEEIMVYEERDNSVFYAVFLIFFAFIVYFFLSLVQSIFIEQRIVKLENDINKQENSIQTYTPILLANGELFVKSKALSGVLQKDIEANKFLDVANTMLEPFPNAKILKYFREGSGVFVITFVTDGFDSVPQVLQSSKNIEDVTNVFVRQIDKFNIQEESVRVTLAFEIEV